MKKLLLLIGFIALVPMVAGAAVNGFTSARTDGMGIAPTQDEDISLIWMFPQKIDEYNAVDYRLETSVTTDNWGGILHKDKSIGKWGLYINSPVPVPVVTTGVGAPAGSQAVASYGAGYPGFNYNLDVLTPQNKLDLFKTFAAGNGVLGIHINYGGASIEPANEWAGVTIAHGMTEKRSTGVLGLDAGYTMSDLGPFSALDAALGYSMVSVDNEATATTTISRLNRSVKDDGMSEIRINARLKKEADENTLLYINVGAKLDSASLKYSQTDDTDGDSVADANDIVANTVKNSATTITLAVNCNHKVNGGAGKVIAGLALNVPSAKSEPTNTANRDAGSATMYNNNTTVTESSGMNVSANLAVEANLLKWLKFRAGMSRQILASVTSKSTVTTYDAATPHGVLTTVTSESKDSSIAALTTTFGLGAEYKNWNIDLLVTPAGIENFLNESNFGEGLLYDGSILDAASIARVDLRYNL